MRTRSILTVLLPLVFFLLSFLLPVRGNVYGQSSFPEKPITIVVHAGPGGGSDIFARTIAVGIEKHKLLSQPIVVENKPGGSGAVSFGYVHGKKKDPYFLQTVTTLFLTTPLRGHTPFTFRDFTPICNFAFDEHMLVTHAKSNYKSLKDMIADAKANPRKVTFGGSFVGGIESFAAYNIEKAAGIKFNFVAFTGSGELMTQLLGGHIDLATANPCEALELEKAGKIRVLGLLADKQYPEAPHILTFRQQGVDAVGVGMNRGLAAPGGIPEHARKVLEEAFFKLTKTETWQKYMKDNLLTEGWMDGPTFGKWLEKRNEQMFAIMKEMGLLKK